MENPLTTGFRFFAECLRHSAKANLHSAKNTRQKIDRQSPLCRVSFIGHSAKPRGHSAKKSNRHGAGPVDGHFAECQPCRHSAKILYIFLKKFFAECQPCRHSAKSFYLFFTKFLCRVPTLQALGKDFFIFFNFFAECQPCRHSAKIFYFF